MSEFREGDLVEAVKGETVMRARVYRDTEWLDGAGRSIAGLRGDGFTVTLIERAKQELPTEPGVYAPVGSFPYYESRLFQLAGDGLWRERGRGADTDTMRELREWVGKGWLTRLEPVPDAARKVLDAVEEAMDRCDWPLSIDDSEAVLAEVKAQFGVTE